MYYTYIILRRKIGSKNARFQPCGNDIQITMTNEAHVASEVVDESNAWKDGFEYKAFKLEPTGLGLL